MTFVSRLQVYSLLIFGVFISCTPPANNSIKSITNNEKTLLFDDIVYEDQIKTVLFYPSGMSQTDVLNPPIINRQEPVPLIIEFDDLGRNYCNYYVKLFHCNANWSRSNYTDLQIVSDFNETLITNYSASINTKVRYMHYSFTVPRVRLTGNYLLVVYRNGDQSDMVISRKFVVYDPLVNVSANVQFATDVKDRDNKQKQLWGVWMIIITAIIGIVVKAIAG